MGNANFKMYPPPKKIINPPPPDETQTPWQEGLLFLMPLEKYQPSPSKKKNLSITLNKLNFNTKEKIPTPLEKISDTSENISTPPETISTPPGKISTSLKIFYPLPSPKIA